MNVLCEDKLEEELTRRFEKHGFLFWRAVSPDFLKEYGLEAKPHEGTKCLIVAGKAHKPAVLREGYLTVASHYRAKEEVNAVERELASFLQACGYAASHSDLPLKQAVSYAGLGCIGRHSLLMFPESGSYITLMGIETDAPLNCTREEGLKRYAVCGSCRRCVDACPTHAIRPEGGIDPVKCLRSYMMSAKPIPEEYRSLYREGFLVGCEVCQRVCPHNARLEPEEGLLLSPIDILEALGDTKELTAGLAPYIGINYARPARLFTQALLWVGNSGRKELAYLAERFLDFPEPKTAEMAQWALNKLK